MENQPIKTVYQTEKYTRNVWHIVWYTVTLQKKLISQVRIIHYNHTGMTLLWSSSESLLSNIENLLAKLRSWSGSLLIVFKAFTASSSKPQTSKINRIVLLKLIIKHTYTHKHTLSISYQHTHMRVQSPSLSSIHTLSISLHIHTHTHIYILSHCHHICIS